MLTQKPALANALGGAQRSLDSAPEQAMRLLLELLGLERQGRHHDVVSHRKLLRGRHPALYAAYMAHAEMVEESGARARREPV